MESSLEVTMCKIGALPYERCRTSATSGETVSTTPALDFRDGRFSTSTGGRRSPVARIGAQSKSLVRRRESKRRLAPNDPVSPRLRPPHNLHGRTRKRGENHP